MDPWHIWVIVAVVMLVLEIFTSIGGIREMVEGTKQGDR
jgi:hypothetical protein